nr:hypothetical protein [uncultured Draconibacterium sp.]
MSGNLQDDVRKFILEIEESKNNGETLAQLTKLQKETAKYRQENEELQKVMAHLASKGERNGKVYKEMEAKLKSNRAEIRKNSDQMKGLEKNLDLNYMTMGQLKKRAMELRSAFNATSKAANPAEYNRLEKELKQVSSQMDVLKGKSRQTQGFLGKLKGAASGFLPALAPVAILAALKRIGEGLFKLTSQIQGETIRSTTVLGDQLGYVEDQADKLAEKMGVTNREFVSMVANTGDLLIPLDFTRQKAAEMATQVQSLAGALDEWTAGKYGVAEVSEILTKAMLGEMEQLKGLGIAIRQDSKEYTELVKQKEQEEGATNAQARAMATLELLYKKSADAQAAYMQQGNKLLRLNKSVSLWFKQLKEDIAMGFNESMKSATERYLEQQKVVKGLQNNLEPLLDQYDELANKKVPLTATEQKRLNDLVGDIATIMPAAVTEVDKYGKALGISTDAARLLIAEQKKYLLIKNADEIKEQEKALEKLNKKLDEQVTLKNHLLYSAKKEPEYAGFYEERIKNASSEIDKLVELKESREAYLKVLKGEPLIPDPDPDGGTEEKTVSLIKLQEDLLETAKKMPETTEAEIASKNKKIAAIEKEIKRLNELGVAQSNVDGNKPSTDNYQTEEEDSLGIESWMTDGKWDKYGAEELAARQASEEEWTQFLTSEIQKRIDAEAEALQIEQEIAEARREINTTLIESTGQVASSLAGMFEQGSAAQVAFIAMEKAAGIAKIWINYAKEAAAIRLAAAEINAVTFGIGGNLWGAAQLAKAKASAIAGTAIIGAQTIASAVSSRKSKKTKGYATGGFANEEQYIVSEKDKPEWISPNWMLNDPFSGGIINFLERYRQNPAQVKSVAAKPVSSASVSNTQSPAQTIDVDKFDRAITRLEQLEWKISYQKFEQLEKEYKRQQQGSGM